MTLLVPADSATTAAFHAWQVQMRDVQGYSLLTVEAYRHDVLAFMQFFAKHIGEEVTLEILNALTSKQLRPWLAERHRKQFDPHSTSRALSAVKHFAGFLREEHGIDMTALTALRPPKGKQALPKSLESSDVMQLLATLADYQPKTWVGLRDKALAMVLYGCGVRIAEALSLHASAIDGVGCSIRILGKGRKERIVPLLPQVMVALQEYQSHCPYETAGATLFYGERGKPLQAAIFARKLIELRRALMLPEHTTAHALRHSFATHLMEAGGGLRDIQELLGHASLSTTQRYTAVDTKQMLKVYRAAHPLQVKTP
jgi:integrase/recombinase XerC